MIKLKIPQIDQKLIGVIVLAVGIIAVFTVAGIAVNKFTGTKTFEKEAQTNSASQEVKQKQTEDQKISNKVKNRKPSDIKESNIIGNWESYLRNYRALMQIKNGFYRLILIANDNPRVRQHSAGRYEIRGNIVIFKPDASIAPPQTNNVSYSNLTRSEFPMVVGMYKGRQIWQEVSEDSDIYVPNYHAVLSQAKDKVAVWSVLK